MPPRRQRPQHAVVLRGFSWGGTARTHSMANGRMKVQILYDDRQDLLYLRLEERPQEVINRRLNDDVVLDIGEDDRIVGIEILDASQRLNLSELLPIQYRQAS